MLRGLVVPAAAAATEAARPRAPARRQRPPVSERRDDLAQYVQRLVDLARLDGGEALGLGLLEPLGACEVCEDKLGAARDGDAALVCDRAVNHERQQRVRARRVEVQGVAADGAVLVALGDDGEHVVDGVALRQDRGRERDRGGCASKLSRFCTPPPHTHTQTIPNPPPHHSPILTWTTSMPWVKKQSSPGRQACPG